MADQPLDPNLPQNALLPPINLAIKGMTGAFLVDPDRAEKFITEVSGCTDMLDEAVLATRQAGRVRPPGGDPVTENAVVQAKRMADNAERAIIEYQRQLLDTAAALREQLSAYRATEHVNTTGSG